MFLRSQRPPEVHRHDDVDGDAAAVDLLQRQLQPAAVHGLPDQRGHPHGRERSRKGTASSKSGLDLNLIDQF